MPKDQEYEGEEAAARTRRHKHDVNSAIVGIVALILALLFRVLFKQAVIGFFNKIKAVLGDTEAWGIAFIAGVSLFVLTKFIIFLCACSNDSPFSLRIRLKVAILHYLNFLIAYPAFLLSVILVSLTNCLILWVVAKSYSLELKDWTYGVTSVILIAVVLVVLKISKAISKNRERDLGSVILDIAYRGFKTRTPELANSNKVITETLVSLESMDLLCITAVHFSHLMRHPERLEEIMQKNPAIAVYFLPHFPYTKYILERAAELSYPFKSAYLGPLVRGICNAMASLHAHVRLRHDRPDFRLVTWAKLSGSSAGKLPHEIPPENLIERIESGGFFAQQYVHSQEGHESPYILAHKYEWKDALMRLTKWFFLEWNEGSPIFISELVADENKMRRVARDLGLQRRRVNKWIETGKLASRLEKRLDLRDLYEGINIVNKSSQ